MGQPLPFITGNYGSEAPFTTFLDPFGAKNPFFNILAGMRNQTGSGDMRYFVGIGSTTKENGGIESAKFSQQSVRKAKPQDTEHNSLHHKQDVCSGYEFGRYRTPHGSADDCN